ncbi:MAG TPA: hypothetical protein VI461_01015 [Chitinophagaceae bacterium]|nr:hypothetical protein [Chitinophagaceae bacterium]
MLRKIVLIVPVLFLNILMYAQFKKGDKMVGASIGSLFYNNSSTDFSNSLGSSSTETDNYGIVFSPAIGWFISEDIVIGAAPMISYNKQKQLGKSSGGSTYLKNESNQFGVSIGGFSRYYFKGASNNLRFFGQYNLSFGFGGSKSEGFEYETLGLYVDRYDNKSSGDFMINTGVNLGLSKFVGSHASIDFYVGYGYSYIKSNPSGTSVRDYADPGTADITTQIEFEQKITGHNIILGIGFQLFLEKKK